MRAGWQQYAVVRLMIINPRWNSLSWVIHHLGNGGKLASWARGGWSLRQAFGIVELAGDQRWGGNFVGCRLVVARGREDICQGTNCEMESYGIKRIIGERRGRNRL